MTRPFFFCCLWLLLGCLAWSPAKTRRYRLVWCDDPTQTITVAWEAYQGSGAVVHYGPEDLGQAAQDYPLSSPIGREVSYHEMNNCFAKLTGLKANTRYYFVIRDRNSVSPRFYFDTASKAPNPFTFCAGGDSRNHRKVRRKANRTVAKLQPLFVAFTGDMINRDDAPSWQDWLDDWQETTRADGRMIPILPHRGNHESRGNKTLYQLFDTTPDNYYALNFSGNLMRFYVLNSEMAAGGHQGDWLAKDLAAHAGKTRHLCAGYHKPMRPVVSAKSEGDDEYQNWARLFYQYGMDLVFESDSHAIKRTLPLRPSREAGSFEGFIVARHDDEQATVYTGEGCWGAPLRAADDDKPWLLAKARFNGFDWVHVYPDHIEVRTVRVDREYLLTPSPGHSPFDIPTGIELWTPPSGALLTIPGDGAPIQAPVQSLAPGEPLTIPRLAAQHSRYFRVEASEASKQGLVELSGAKGDADLFLRAGQLPTRTHFDDSSHSGDCHESLKLTDQAESELIIEVRGVHDATDLQLILKPSEAPKATNTRP